MLLNADYMIYGMTTAYNEVLNILEEVKDGKY